MRFYLGVTDTNWFEYLSQKSPEDVNFWQPGGRLAFKALKSGAPFLFKLKSPYNAIGGLGFFSSHTFLPIEMAWQTFGFRNGADTYQEFRGNIDRLRRGDNSLKDNPNIGCIVLTNPIFFEREDWIPQPETWKRSIVQGAGYSTDTHIGNRLWSDVEDRLRKYHFYEQTEAGSESKSQLILEEPESEYGKSVLTKVRLGQGAFRVLVTDAYSRRCAITGEKTLPALEAAHIKPYAESGPHFISNGLLLRSDLHKLFDSGYMTITKNYDVEVSKRIKEEYNNGREYYKFHGQQLFTLPNREMDRPSQQYIEWHNSTCFKG